MHKIDPLVEYTNEGFQLFDEMLDTINREITKYLLKAEIKQNLERKEVVKPTGTNDSKDRVKKQLRKVEKIGRNEPCPCGSVVRNINNVVESRLAKPYK